MNKVNFNPFSEILVEDFLRQSGYIGDAFKSFIADFLCQNTAILGLDVTAQAVANMTVYVKPGRIYQAGSQGQLEVNLDPALTITAAHPTYARIDRICVQYHEIADIPETRNVMMDTVTRQVTQKTVMTRIASNVDFLVVTGVAAPGPAAPTVPDGWTSIAQINVRANTTSILQTDITDERPTLKSLMTHTHTGGVDGAPIGSNGLSDNSVTDPKIGNRTITDTTTAATGTNTLTKLLSMLGNMIKSITGKTNWYTAPATTLESLSTQYWKASTAYALGTIIRSPAVVHSYKYFECTTAGTSGTTEPTWGAAGTTVTDGTAVWTIRDVRDARKLQTARKINGVNFDGSADITLKPADIGSPSRSPSGESFSIFPSVNNIVATPADLSTINPTVRFRFSTANDGSGKYADAIDLSTYVDDTGGGVNSLLFRKDKHRMEHWYGTWGSNSWISKKIAYLDEVAPAGYGLGTDATVVTDFHSITKCGFFKGYNALNSPPALSDRWITVVASAIVGTETVTLMAQSYHPLDVGKVWTCSQYGGTWSAWKQLATTDQIQPATDYVVAQQLGTNGYTRWASGKLEQWGVIANVSLTQTIQQPVTYPTPYPAGVTPNITGMILMPNYVQGAMGIYVVKTSVNNIGFTIGPDPSDSTSTGDISWRSVG